jgi:hypothetical protein
MSRVSSLLVSASFLASIPFLALGTSGAQAASCSGVGGTQCDTFCGGADNVANCETSGSNINCFCQPTTKPGPGQKKGTETTFSLSGSGNLDNPQTQPPECTGNKGQCKQQGF